MEMELVVGCPCNKIRIFEDFIWNSRYQIAEYFKNMEETLKRKLFASRDVIQAIENLPEEKDES